MKNKRGEGEKLVSIYWFVILIIITLGVVAGTLKVFGEDIDIREAEASLLKDKVVDCLIEKGELNSKYGDLESNNLESLSNVCNIMLNQDYYVMINNNEFGDSGILVECDLNQARCYKTSIFVLNNGEKMFLEIKTGVRK